MDHEVKVGEREAILVVAKRLAVRLPEIGGVLGGAFGEVYRHLERGGAATAGPPFVIYYGVPEGDQPIDIEICAPVGGAVDPPEGWRLEELPAGTFATLLHLGSYESIGATYDAMTSWIGAHDLAVTGPPREVYLSEPDTPVELIRTIIEFPVAEAPTPVAG